MRFVRFLSITAFLTTMAQQTEDIKGLLEYDPTAEAKGQTALKPTLELNGTSS
jgi:hypothetical protein